MTPRENSGWITALEASTCVTGEQQAQRGLPTSTFVAAIDGDPRAWQQLYRAFHRRIAVLSLGVDSDRDDFVQSCFADAYSSRRQVREAEKFGAWLMTIARRKRAQAYHEKQRARWEPLEAERVEGQSSAGFAMDAEKVVATRLMVNRLSEPVRSYWIARHVRGLSLEELAKTECLSLSTAKRRLREAQIRLSRL